MAIAEVLQGQKGAQEGATPALAMYRLKSRDERRGKPGRDWTEILCPACANGVDESGENKSIEKIGQIADSDARCERCPKPRILHGTEFVVDIVDVETIKRLIAGLEKRMHYEFEVKCRTESYTTIVTWRLDKYECQRVDLFIDGFRWRAGDVEFW